MNRMNIFRVSCILFCLFIVSCVTRAEELTLEMIFKYNLFNARKVTGLKSMKDGLFYTVLENSADIVKYSYASGEKSDTLFSSDWIEDLKFSEIISYDINEDETTIIFSSGQEKIYRYSYRASYYVYDIIAEKLIPVYSEGKQQFAELSPDGRNVAFVIDNNLYLKNMHTGQLIQITSDGSKNSIINGAPDWLYEEEFALKSGCYWSPDGRKLAFYRIDESKVEEYSLIFYESLYPELYTYKYPKAGSANPVVDIYTYDLISGITRKMEISSDSDYYVPRIKWLPTSDRICVTKINRLQNKADLIICDATGGSSQVFYTEENEKYIAKVTDDYVTFIDSGRYAIILSEQDGFKHLYHYSIDGKLIGQITKGSWEIEEFCGLDENTGRLYYTSTEISPLERHLYSINLDGTRKKQLTFTPGVHTAVFNNNYNYYILTSSDAQTPYSISLYNRQGEMVRALENNDFIRDLMTEYGFMKKEFFTYYGNDNTELHAFKIVPPDFRKNKKYPVLIYVYGGPESQMVINSWENRLAWFQLLAQKGYVVVCADNRGTDGRGEEFRKSVYLHLGRYETEDQIALAEYLAAQSYIDKNRIGIFGWSYGAYMTLLCMTRGNHIFKTGVAVAPVTDWKFYDTVYTERFMRKPVENAEGYKNSSVLNYIGRLEGNLLLIHGLADDNVHFQHAAGLITQIKKENKKVDMFLYPNENHLMRGSNALFHVYSVATDYILSNL